MTTRTLPAHGTRACYLRGCRRDECRDAHRRYCKQYDIRRHRQGPVNIDATEATNHVQALIALGWTQAAIAQTTGVGTTIVVSLANNAQRTIRPDHAAAILSIQPGSRPTANYWTNPTGTVRRIRALAAIGWPVYTTAQAIGVDQSGLNAIASGRRNHIPRHVAEAIAALYIQRSRQPGPSDITRARAARNDWHGPLAWDDIDDPDATPELDDAVAVELDRSQLAELRRAEILHLARFGNSPEHIHMRLGGEVSLSYIREIVRTLWAGPRDRATKAAA